MTVCCCHECASHPVLSLQDICYAYGRVKALDQVSGVFQKGSLVAIAGPNGAGKSTLLKILAGIIAPQSGQLIYAPDVGTIGYLPQISAVDRTYPISVRDAASAGLWPKTGSCISLCGKPRQLVNEALERVGLADNATRQIDELSGGQFQRLLFARLMLQDPDLILLDEPFAAVDADATQKFMEILLSWHEQGRTIICVLHDLMLVRKYFPQSFLLAGKCLGLGHTHQLFEQNLLSYDLDMAELHCPDENNSFADKGDV
ncbi:MAG: ABC transporter ATP-binding protein [Proteobacteria bacterium]|jgi:zinc/manganese transport system ATP-binding protein|nr:ABC transporter ATP-binding protein [Alphaproteobacteria bacterium]NCC03497.1 ABC transporter ATP-binding protein [Pseudomonadota bacterium]